MPRVKPSLLSFSHTHFATEFGNNVGALYFFIKESWSPNWIIRPFSRPLIRAGPIDGNTSAISFLKTSILTVAPLSRFAKNMFVYIIILILARLPETDCRPSGHPDSIRL